MADQTTTAVAAQHPAETWAALIGSVTLIVGMVGVLYKRLNDDIKGHDDKLNAGIKRFSEIGEKLVSIGEKIQSIEKEDAFELEEIDRLELEIKSLHSRLLIIETEHKDCREIVKGLHK